MKTQWKKFTHRLLSGAMALAMMCSFLPTTAFAALETGETQKVKVYIYEGTQWTGESYDYSYQCAHETGHSSYNHAMTYGDLCKLRDYFQDQTGLTFTQFSKGDYLGAGSKFDFPYSFESGSITTHNSTCIMLYAAAPQLHNHSLQFNKNTADAVDNMPAAQVVYETSDSFSDIKIPVKIPTRTGYKFLGWGTDAGDTTVDYYPNQRVYVSGTTTLYAVWEEIPVIQYTVTYTDGVSDEMVFANQSYTVDEDDLTPAFAGGNPTRDGYIFTGWTPEVKETVTMNVDYTAQWALDENKNGIADEDEIEYSIYFNYNNGTAYGAWLKAKSETTPYAFPFDSFNAEQLNIEEDEKLVYDGYEFLGWAETVDGAVVAKNFAEYIYPEGATDYKVITLTEAASQKTYYAQWKKAVADLTIEVTGGKRGSETKPDGTLALKVDVEGGTANYTVTSTDGTVKVKKPTGDGKLIVTEPGEYTVTVTDKKGKTAETSFKIVEVTFESNGGSDVPHQLLKLDPIGGSTGGVEVTAGPVIEGPTEQLSLYPTVMRAPVKGATVKFPIATRPEDPTYADHTFIDWYEEDTFATTYDFNKQVTENITLYADWEAEETTPPATDKPEDTTPPSTSNPKPTPTKKPASTPAPVVPPVVITTATPAPTATPVAPVVAPADPEPVEPEATATPEPTATPEATVAPEATAAPTDDAKDNANIEQEEVPLAAPAQSASSWALLNLILAIATAAISLVLLVGYFLKHKQDDEDEENSKKSGFMRVVSVVPAIVAVVVFVLTENMANPMAFIDKWTLAMVLIAIVQLAIVLKVRKDEND